MEIEAIKALGEALDDFEIAMDNWRDIEVILVGKEYSREDKAAAEEELEGVLDDLRASHKLVAKQLP